ncbi:MAG: cytochrome c nitrite reductase small subunit [Phycisphaerales bacterium]
MPDAPRGPSPARSFLGLGLAGLVLSTVLGVFLGLSLYTFNHAEGLSYMSDDPRACVNCHIMREQYDGWQKTAHHAAATCNDCHVPHDLIGKYIAKVDHGYRHSKGFTFQDFHEPIQITRGDLQIVNNNCLRCHSGLVSELNVHTPQGVQSANCVHCHAGIGHGPKR